MEPGQEIVLSDTERLGVSYFGRGVFYLNVSYEDSEDGFTVERDHTFQMNRDELNELADAIYIALKRSVH